MTLVVYQIQDRSGIGLSSKILKKLKAEPGAILRFQHGTGSHESRVWQANTTRKGVVVSSIISKVYRLQVGDTIRIVQPRPESN